MYRRIPTPTLRYWLRILAASNAALGFWEVKKELREELARRAEG